MKELFEMLQQTGFPVAYHHFEEGKGPQPPFIVYYLKGTDNFSADGRVYKKVERFTVELYTDEKDPIAEWKVEQQLDGKGIYWEKSEMYIEEEYMYEIAYELEV